MANSILIVDDDPDIRANLFDIFSDLGYVVELAPEGSVALELASKRSFDVALLDLKMPGMDGVEVYRRLKQIDPGIVAIIVTAYAASETAKAALAAGAWDLLAKPVDLRRLMPLVEDSVHRPLILLVDDDRELCQSLWDVLREERCRTCLAHDADEALTLLNKRLFDVALVDLKLPERSGQDVLREVRARSAGTVTVLITGHPDDLPALDDSRDDNLLDRVMTKPLDINRVLTVLTRGQRPIEYGPS